MSELVDWNVWERGGILNLLMETEYGLKMPKVLVDLMLKYIDWIYDAGTINLHNLYGTINYQPVPGFRDGAFLVRNFFLMKGICLSIVCCPIFRLCATGQVIIDGEILNNGDDGWNGDFANGGKSGGYIDICSEEEDIIISGRISAEGGRGRNGAGGGAGGIIRLMSTRKNVIRTTTAIISTVGGAGGTGGTGGTGNNGGMGGLGDESSLLSSIRGGQGGNGKIIIQDCKNK
jgi:hypothetical protein